MIWESFLKNIKYYAQILISWNRILEVVVGEEMMAMNPPSDSSVANWAEVCGQAFGRHCMMECTLDKELRFEF